MTESDDRTRPASSKSRHMQTTRNCPMTCFPLCHGQVPTDELDTDRDISAGQYDEELSADHSPPLNGFALGSQAGMPYAGIELGRRNDCDTTGTHQETLSRSAFLLSVTRREITGLLLGKRTVVSLTLPKTWSYSCPDHFPPPMSHSNDWCTKKQVSKVIGRTERTVSRVVRDAVDNRTADILDQPEAGLCERKGNPRPGCHARYRGQKRGGGSRTRWFFRTSWWRDEYAARINSEIDLDPEAEASSTGDDGAAKREPVRHPCPARPRRCLPILDPGSRLRTSASQ